MSKIVWYRTRLVGNDEIVIELKRWGWPKGWQASYYPYASYSSSCNKLESELVAAVQKLHSLITRFVEADTMRIQEVKAAKKHNSNVYGLSDPMQIRMKDLLKYAECHNKPDSSVYYEALNKQWMAKLGLVKRKSSETEEGSAGLSRRPRSNRTVYTTASDDIIKRHGIEVIGGKEHVDDTIAYKENKSSNGKKSGKKAEKQAFRKANPYSASDWESQGDYESWVTEKCE